MPSHVRPLADHPQLKIIQTRVSGATDDRVTEYRVYNYRRWNNGTIVRGDGFGWIDLFWLVGLVLSWRWLSWDLVTREGFFTSFVRSQNATWVAAVLWFTLRQCTRTLNQSIVALPDLGVQLQTSRGISLAIPFQPTTKRYYIPLTTVTTFIPLEQISTIVINEGLRRWRVEYYLAVIKNGGSGIIVGFDVVRPPIAVLKEVCHGLREELFDEYAT